MIMHWRKGEGGIVFDATANRSNEGNGGGLKGERRWREGLFLTHNQLIDKAIERQRRPKAAREVPIQQPAGERLWRNKTREEAMQQPTFLSQ
jgi:hypothetical protein